MEAQLLPPRPAHDCWKWEHRVPMRTLDQKGKTRHRLSDLCRYKGTCIFGVFSCIRFWPHSYWKLQWSVGRGKDSESDRNRCRPPPPHTSSEKLRGRQAEPGLAVTPHWAAIHSLVNLGAKPNLWGHWTSADMGFASGGRWGTSTVCVSKLLSRTHLITAWQIPAYTWPWLCSIWCLSFVSFWHFSPRTSADSWGQLSFLPAIPQGLWKWFNCSQIRRKNTF